MAGGLAAGIRHAARHLGQRYATTSAAAQLRAKLRRHDAPPIGVRVSDRVRHKYDVVIHRAGGRIDIEVCGLGEGIQFGALAHLGAAYVYWLLHCPPEVRHMSVTVSDGDQSSWARYAPSTERPWQVPIPDPHYFVHEGFAWARTAVERDGVAWAERSGNIVWRGAGSGIGSFDPLIGEATPALATQRLLLWLAARDLPGVDIGLADYSRDQMARSVLADQGVLKAAVPERSWLGRKFAIDIDGHTNTWSNLLVRLHFGCCVLKVASRYGFRQWYYDRLVPWEHYVPVAADLSDFAEKLDWVRANDARAAEIAASGQAFARALAFDATRDEAVDLITRHWPGDDPYNPPGTA